MTDKSEKAIYDKLQTKLTPTGTEPNTFKYAVKTIQETIGQNMVLCPFCLNHYYLFQFQYEKGFYECKFCHNKMMGKTLIMMFEIFNSSKIDVEKYAKWVYGYRTSGFFKKINFKDWKEMLHFWDISTEFWDYYNKFKGENKNLHEKTKLEELGY